MKKNVTSGLGHNDLTVEYYDHTRGKDKALGYRDFQVAVGEFVGTFFLAFIIAATKNNPAAGSQPLAIGLGLIGVIHMMAPISGSQLNPAVSIGLVMRNKLNWIEAAYCIASQIAGALVAGLIVIALYSNRVSAMGYPAVADGDDRGGAFFAEIVQTFILLTVVLNTATTNAQADNSYYGIAIGFVVLSGALVLGGVSGDTLTSIPVIESTFI
jgi:aquaporin Z